MPHLVREQNHQQRERKRNAQQQQRGCSNGSSISGKRILRRGKRLAILRVRSREFRAHRQRRNHRQQKENQRGPKRRRLARRRPYSIRGRECDVEDFDRRLRVPVASLNGAIIGS